MYQIRLPLEPVSLVSHTDPVILQRMNIIIPRSYRVVSKYFLGGWCRGKRIMSYDELCMRTGSVQTVKKTKSLLETVWQIP